MREELSHRAALRSIARSKVCRSASGGTTRNVSCQSPGKAGQLLCQGKEGMVLMYSAVSGPLFCLRSADLLPGAQMGVSPRGSLGWPSTLGPQLRGPGAKLQGCGRICSRDQSRQAVTQGSGRCGSSWVPWWMMLVAGPRLVKALARLRPGIWAVSGSS